MDVFRTKTNKLYDATNKTEFGAWFKLLTIKKTQALQNIISKIPAFKWMFGISLALDILDNSSGERINRKN